MRNKKINLLNRIGCWLIGWNPQILEECQEASYRTLKRYMSAILILSIIWGTIGYCFADRYLDMESIISKCCVSMVFITIIISIERFVILTIGKNKWMTIFRISLALLMAGLGSTIFDQIIFADDVNLQMKGVKTEWIKAEIPQRTARIEAESKNLSLKIDSISKINGDLYVKYNKNPTLKTYDTTSKKTQIGVDSLGKPQYKTETETVRKTKDNPITIQINANEKSVEMFNKQLSELRTKQFEVEKNVRKEYDEAKVGFLQELTALKEIMSENVIALVFYIILFSFLLLLEMLVVTSKLGDDASDYDMIIKHQLDIKKATLASTVKKLTQTDKT